MKVSKSLAYFCVFLILLSASVTATNQSCESPYNVTFDENVTQFYKYGRWIEGNISFFTDSIDGRYILYVNNTLTETVLIVGNVTLYMTNGTNITEPFSLEARARNISSNRISIKCTVKNCLISDIFKYDIEKPDSIKYNITTVHRRRIEYDVQKEKECEDNLLKTNSPQPVNIEPPPVKTQSSTCDELAKVDPIWIILKIVVFTVLGIIVYLIMDVNLISLISQVGSSLLLVGPLLSFAFTIIGNGSPDINLIADFLSTYICSLVGGTLENALSMIIVVPASIILSLFFSKSDVGKMLG